MNNVEIKEYGRQYYLDNKDKYKEYYKKNKKEILLQQKEYSEKNKDKIRIRDHQHYISVKDKDIVKKKQLKRKYDITFEQFMQIKVMQNYRCSICTNLFKNSQDTCVDHIHETGKVRGLLCRNCNSAIGCFKEDTTIMQQAIVYLNVL